MKCPFCGYENIEGEDSCVSCGEDLTAFDKTKSLDSLEKRLVRESALSAANCTAHIFAPNTPLEQVIPELQNKNSYGIIVDQGKILGVITVRDLLQKAIFKDLDLATTKVEELMTLNPETIEVTDKIVHALNKMAIGGFRHLPIVEDGKFRGAISSIDILEYLAKLFPEHIHAKA